MNRKKEFSPPVVGGSSLLVIFAVLCLTVFALLSLSTAMADERLNHASVKAVTDYYEADTQAEEIFARLRSGQVPDGVLEADGSFIYSCPISETQTLQVEVQNQNGTWKVLRWQAESTMEYQENTWEVWEGEAP